MTPAISALKQSNVSFELLEYQHDASTTAYGLEVVEKLELNAEGVFKTLVLETDKSQLVVALVPVSAQLNLKKLAKGLRVKKVSMAPVKQVENTTGYILGGVSPIGQKKRLPTLIDISAKQLDIIYVSAGKRGLELALSPTDLAKMTRATFLDIAN